MKFWIARNKGKWGGLYLYRERPIKKIGGPFQPSVCDPYCIQLDGNKFPEVTFENSPREYELKLVDNGISN